MFRNQQQRLHCGLRFFGVVFGLGQFGDLARGVAEGDERRFPARQYDRIKKALVPLHSGDDRNSAK
jgi:hypothetical protein